MKSGEKSQVVIFRITRKDTLKKEGRERGARERYALSAPNSQQGKRKTPTSHLGEGRNIKFRL